MTTPNPPSIGDTNWGSELNDFLENTLVPEISTNASNFSNHIAAAPVTATSADPHGDRAYALALMAPFIQNINKASGVIQLNAAGQMPLGTWQDLRPVATAFTSQGSGQALYPPQYQVCMDGTVRLAGYFYISATTYNGQRVFVTALPLSLRPNMPVDIPVTLNAAGTSALYETPMITIGTDGSVTLNGCPGGLAAGTAVGIYGWYPLDSYYSLIET